MYSNTLPKKIRKLNEQIKFYLKCMVPPEVHQLRLKSNYWKTKFYKI